MAPSSSITWGGMTPSSSIYETWGDFFQTWREIFKEEDDVDYACLWYVQVKRCEQELHPFDSTNYVYKTGDFAPMNMVFSHKKCR